MTLAALLVLTLGLGAFTVQAKTAYVTDEFKITLRSGESATHRILRMLPTGEKLNVLSSNPNNGYSKVRTASGAEGFVLTRQLVDQPVARDRLAAALMPPVLLAGSHTARPAASSPPGRRPATRIASGTTIIT